jgi:RNA polymerase sigma-70 factor, ECF subfamily
VNQRWSELAEKSQSGDKVAYHQLLSEIAPVLRQFLQYKIRNETWREDVMQEVFLSLHKSFHTFRPGDAFEPWFFSIARYKVIDYYRRNKRRFSKEDSLSFGLFSAELGGLLSTDMSVSFENSLEDTLVDALNSLPERQKNAVMLLKVDGCSVKEASAKMGVTESALKVLAHRGYKALRSILRKDG